MTMVKVVCRKCKTSTLAGALYKQLNQLMIMTQRENNKDEGDYEDDCEPTRALYCTDAMNEKDDYDPTQVIHTHAYKKRL